MQVVDTTGVGSFTMHYDDGTADDVIGFGAGVYYKPAYYPAELLESNAFIAGAQGAQNSATDYLVRILADDGPNGSPGTVLYSETIDSMSVILNAYNTVVPTNPLRITSGGFYISWDAGSTSAANAFVGWTLTRRSPTGPTK